MGIETETIAYVRNRADAPAYWTMGILWIMLATSEETGGSYSLIEELIPQGLAAPPHVHEEADEMFYILEGEATFFVDSTPLKATPGSIVSIPRGTKHSFQVDTPTARLLNTYTPAGFEYTIIALSETATERTLPPGPVAPPDMARHAETLRRVVEEHPAARTTNYF
ncbi:MAG: cupin domain-containing protein [Akkermansiaceae bacterium]|nr:cupin domain-containing protein [Armatimonadota bacterium]